MRRSFALLTILLLSVTAMHAQDANKLYYTLRSKVLSVNDYVAEVKMKVDVTFMEVPVLHGKLYFKAPDKLRLERDGGIAILPRHNDNLTLNNLIPTGEVTVLDAGLDTLKGKVLRVLKVIPNEEQDYIVLSKIWVDTTKLLVMRTETTTRNDGTVVMTLHYGKYANYALPDEVVVHMNLKDYKLPEGMTLDYNDVPKAIKKDGKKRHKGTITIHYLNYRINTGEADSAFGK